MTAVTQAVRRFLLLFIALKSWQTGNAMSYLIIDISRFSIFRLIVGAHLRGIRPTLTAKKDPLMLRRNSNFLLLLRNFHYNSIMSFNCCAYIRIRI